MNERIDILLSNFLKNSLPAHGLPAVAYNDSEFWEIESETVFTQNWVFVGLVLELKKPGDVVTFSVADHPLYLI